MVYSGHLDNTKEALLCFVCLGYLTPCLCTFTYQARVSVQMQPELRRYIQHISLSPDSINNDDVGSFYLFKHLLIIFFISSGASSCMQLFPCAPCRCDSPSGRRPTNEVLTRHDGHPHRQPCEGEPDEVITSPKALSSL